MTGQELSDRADRLAENSFLKLIGRFGMMLTLPIFVASMTWLGSTIWSLNTEQAKMRGELYGLRSDLSGRIDVLTERVGTSVIRSSDVDLSFKLRDQRIEYLEKSIVEIHRALGDHGTRLYKLEQQTR